MEEWKPASAALSRFYQSQRMKHRKYKKQINERQKTLFRPKYKVIYKENTFCGSKRKPTQDVNIQGPMKPAVFMSYTSIVNSVVINQDINSLIDSTVRDQGLPHGIDHLLKELVSRTKSYNSDYSTKWEVFSVLSRMFEEKDQYFWY